MNEIDSKILLGALREMACQILELESKDLQQLSHDEITEFESFIILFDDTLG